MAVSEDLVAFFADFGVTAVFGAESGKVLFDSPENIIAEDYAVTAEYAITYRTGLFNSLAHGSSITVNGTSYTVNTITAIEDGQLKKATLSSV